MESSSWKKCLDMKNICIKSERIPFGMDEFSPFRCSYNYIFHQVQPTSEEKIQVRKGISHEKARAIKSSIADFEQPNRDWGHCWWPCQVVFRSSCDLLRSKRLAKSVHRSRGKDNYSLHLDALKDIQWLEQHGELQKPMALVKMFVNGHECFFSFSTQSILFVENQRFIVTSMKLVHRSGVWWMRMVRHIRSDLRLVPPTPSIVSSWHGSGRRTSSFESAMHRRAIASK